MRGRGLSAALVLMFAPHVAALDLVDRAQIPKRTGYDPQRGSVYASLLTPRSGTLPLFQIIPLGGGGGGTTTIVSGTTVITGGADTQVCFNDAGTLSCGDAGMVFNKTTDLLTLNGGITLTTTGVINRGTTDINLSAASTIIIRPNTGNGSSLTWGLGIVGGTANQLHQLSSTAIFGLSGPDAAAPAPITLLGGGSRGGTDTNTAGAAVSLGPGAGTGTAAQPILGQQYPETKASGTVAQTYSASYAIPSTLFTATADATAGNSASELSFLGTGVGTKTLDAGIMRIGRHVRITVRGFITNTGTPTLNIKVKFGSTSICTTGAQTMTAITGTKAFKVICEITTRTVGATGTVYAQGDFSYDSAVTGFQVEDMVNSATITVDMTASQAIDVTGTWGTSNAANTMTGTNAVIEILN